MRAAVGLTLLDARASSTGIFWSLGGEREDLAQRSERDFRVTDMAVYFVLAMYRSTASWRGRRAAWLGVLGFALVLLHIFGRSTVW